MKLVLLLALILPACATCPPCDETGLRYMLDVSERRIEETESQLGMCRNETRMAYKDLDEALEQLERADDDADEGRAYAKDLIHKLDIMETHDRQREDLRAWAGGPEVPEL